MVTSNPPSAPDKRNLLLSHDTLNGESHLHQLSNTPANGVDTATNTTQATMENAIINGARDHGVNGKSRKSMTNNGKSLITPAVSR